MKKKIQIYKSKRNGQFAWRAIAKNNRKIGCSGETYHNKKDLDKTLVLLFGTELSNFVMEDLTVKK